MAEQGPAAPAVVVREAVAVFRDVVALEAAVEDLRAAGFRADDLSLLAGQDAVERELGHRYARVQELEDEPAAPRTAYVSLKGLADREDAVGSSMTVLPTLLGAGTVVATAGALAAAVVGTAMAGAAIGTALTHFMDRRHADALQEQLEAGGILLWVRTADADRERRAVEILTRHAAEDVHVHAIPAPPPPAD